MRYSQTQQTWGNITRSVSKTIRRQIECFQVTTVHSDKQFFIDEELRKARGKKDFLLVLVGIQPRMQAASFLYALMLRDRWVARVDNLTPLFSHARDPIFFRKSA